MTSFRVFLILVAGCLVSMAVAFLMTRHLLREDRLLSRADPLTVEQANELRLLANQLLELAEQLERQADRVQGRALQDWLRLTLRPRLQQYQARLEGQHALPHAPRTHLEAGWSALWQLTQRPPDGEALERGVGTARAAWAETERYIESMQVGGRLSAPRRRVL